jgi:hypothetical protein
LRDRRLAALAVLTLLLLAAGAWAWSMLPDEGGARSAEVAVRGPDGLPFWSGRVELPEGATVLDGIEAAGRAGGFEVVVERHPLGAYVRAIGPYAETATGGWNYCIDSGEGYRWVGVAADVRGLAPGERVLWLWVEDGRHGC